MRSATRRDSTSSPSSRREATLTAEQTGFKRYLSEGVRLEIGDTRTLNIKLEAGAVTETITVTSQATRLGFDLPIQAGKGYSITLKNPTLKIQRPLYLDEARIGCTPFNGALRLAGTMELSGVNSDMHPQRLRAIRRAAGRYFKDGALAEEHGDQSEWMGLRPLTPDGLPAIGRAPGFDNLYLATGHQMLGLTLAPATATVMADLICDGRADFDLRAFDPARFTNGHR